VSGRGLSVLVASVCAVALPLSGPAVAAARPPVSVVVLERGRVLYRRFCGQCHALRAANAVGFGQARLGTDPGPSLNSLRVSWNLCVSAVVLAIGGHETIQGKMSWREVSDVSSFVERVTRGNPIPAKITGANFTSVLPPAK
jgi:hypothetical protein